MKRELTRSASPLNQSIEEQAGVILESLDLEDEEINQIIEEWCSYDFEVGQVARMLTKLQRIAFEYLLKRDKLWGEYKHQFKTRPKIDGIALPVEE